jgi:hypothetical protein
MARALSSRSPGETAPLALSVASIDRDQRRMRHAACRMADGDGGTTNDQVIFFTVTSARH